MRSAYCLLFGAFLLLCGCAHSPQERQLQQCSDCTRAEIVLDSPLTPLIALSIRVSSHPRLHVYLEGDGRPWSRWNTPAADPNSQRLTALQLMQLDTTNRVYLNRPCYGHWPMPAACDSSLWTDGRYSEAVVSAMNAALDQLRLAHSAQELVLIGHSGGGTLAVLLAQRRNDVAAVITLAANLDHRTWTERFGYLPLAGSLNAAAVDLPAQIVRWHLVGAQDQQVPADLTVSAAAGDPLAKIMHFSTFNHHCCWTEIWPAILEDLGKELSQTL